MNTSSIIKNPAYIDGQNLYMSTTTAEVPWCIDLAYRANLNAEGMRQKIIQKEKGSLGN